jgi:hypothetical protein
MDQTDDRRPDGDTCRDLSENCWYSQSFGQFSGALRHAQHDDEVEQDTGEIDTAALGRKQHGQAGVGRSPAVASSGIGSTVGRERFAVVLRM